jgi:hypothetical protein
MIHVCRGRPLLPYLFMFALPLLSQMSESSPARKEKELSQAAQDKIKQKMSESPAGRVLVFNEEGKVTDSVTVTVTKRQIEKYQSLSDFLKSDDSPVDSCKNPVPTPPPPCILCDNGRVVCSNAFNTKPKSQPRQGATHPESKTPTGERPQ